MSTYSQFNPIRGTTGADVLTGGLAFDLFTGGVGNDTINGGGGLNAAVFKGKASDYKITTSKGVVTITGPDGTDVLREVQFAIFSDEVKPLFDTTPIRVGFDEDFYLQSNPDVYDAVKAGTYTSGAQHYQRYGSLRIGSFRPQTGLTPPTMLMSMVTLPPPAYLLSGTMRPMVPQKDAAPISISMQNTIWT